MFLFIYFVYFVIDILLVYIVIKKSRHIGSNVQKNKTKKNINIVYFALTKAATKLQKYSSLTS